MRLEFGVEVREVGRSSRRDIEVKYRYFYNIIPVKGADAVVTSTPSREPTVMNVRFSEGMHFNNINVTCRGTGARPTDP